MRIALHAYKQPSKERVRKVVVRPALPPSVAPEPRLVEQAISMPVLARVLSRETAPKLQSMDAWGK